MSSVRKKERSDHRLTVLDKALDLYEHTTTVIANPKIFKEAHRSLINKIDHEATMIYHCCRVANDELDARKEDEAKARIALEEEALRHCRWLKTYVMMSKRVFHLRAGKVIYWNKLIKIAEEYIKNWLNSEKRRYKENHGL